MKTDRITRILLWTIAGLMAANFGYRLFQSEPATANPAEGTSGRYEISSWGAQSGEFVHPYGYFVIDTVTGKITDRRSFSGTGDFKE